MARFAAFCPRISSKVTRDFRGAIGGISVGKEDSGIQPFSKIVTISCKVETPIAQIPLINEPSRAFPFGRNTYFNHSFLARIHAGIAPGVARRVPSSQSSPKKSPFSRKSVFHFRSHERIAMAIGRSKPDPLFRRLVGARLTVTRFAGKENPEFLSAARTRSLDSCTPASGSHTMEK